MAPRVKRDDYNKIIIDAIIMVAEMKMFLHI